MKLYTYFPKISYCELSLILVVPSHVLRYSWPKEVPATNILDVISAAAAAKAVVAAEDAARETSTNTVRALMQTLSPGRKYRAPYERANSAEKHIYSNVEGRLRLLLFG